MFLAFVLVFFPGCVALSETEIAPYDVLRVGDTKAQIEVRNYERMVLVSAPMARGKQGDGRNGAFGLLFDYISGANEGAKEIAMTAPVFRDQDDAQGAEGMKIPMTAPVFMDDEGSEKMMSFVMPADFTLDGTPRPMHPDVKVHEVTDYKVAAIIFNGRLSDANIAKHRGMLEAWIAENGYEINGSVKSAGYNAPFTLPHLRRNEVLIPVR